MPSWKKVIVSGSDATLNSLSVTTSVTAASLTGSLQTDIIQFTAQTFVDGVEGQLGYSFDNGKLTFYTENDTPIDLGRSIYVRVRNNEATTLTKGTVVDFTATSTGQTPRVKRAIATSGVDCSCFVGVVIKDIPTTGFGYIMLTGVLDGLNLSTFTNGDQIYLSQTNSGSFTTTIPTPPVKAIRIGMVLNAATSPTQGVLFIRPENRTVVFDLADFKETYNTGSFSGSFVGDGSGLTGVIAELSSVTSFSEPFTNQTTVTVVHSLDSQFPFVQVYNTDNELFIPQTIKVIDSDTIRVDFSELSSGYIVVAKGGHIVSGTIENANLLNGQSASFYLDYNNFNNVPEYVTTSSFNLFTSSYTTGSFTGSFVGDGSGLTNLPIIDIDTSTLVTTSSFNSYTSSADGRLDSLETESGSIRTDLNTSISNFNSYTSSNDSTNSTQNSRIGSLESFTSSLNSAISLDGSNVTILGNLEVAGTQTIIDSTTVQIGDNIIELNGTGAVNGGLLIRDVTGPNTVSGSLLWDTTNDIWIAGQLGSESKILLAIGDGVVSGSSQISFNGITDKPTLVSGSSQIDLTGTTNYISGIKSRLNAESVISSSVQVNADTITNFDTNVKDKLNTDNVHSGSFLGTATTTNLTEGTNLYYTDTRVKTKLNADSVISGSSQVDINSTTGTLNVNKGGTGQTTYTNGQLLIGNTTGNTLTKATLTEGTGITITNGTGTITITNASPNATHTGDVTGATALTIASDAVGNTKLANMTVNTIKGRITTGTGDPEDLTASQVRTIINVADGATANTGTVTSVGGTGTVSGLTLSGTVTTSGNLTLGGTLSVTPSNFSSQTANTFLAAPNGTAGVPTFRAIVAADVPTLNQNTTGTAANVTGTVAIANGGTGATTNTAARTNLGATTLGSNLFTITNPSAIRFLRVNADNTVSSLTDSDFRTAIGAYASSNPSGYTTNTGTVTSIATNNGITGGTITTTGTLGLTGQALALHNLATNGIIARTGAGTVAGRTITGTANQVTVTNGDGVSGNPTLSLPQNIHTAAIPTFSGSIFNGDVTINGRLLSGQQNLDVDSGAVRVIATIPTSSYDAAFFDYVIKKSTNLRAGTVYAVHNGTTVEFTETSTNDIGTTTDVTLSSDISGGNIRLLATTLSNDWIIKTLVRGL